MASMLFHLRDMGSLQGSYNSVMMTQKTGLVSS